MCVVCCTVVYDEGNHQTRPRIWLLTKALPKLNLKLSVMPTRCHELLHLFWSVRYSKQLVH
jgi:hypothetical protein